LGHSLLRISLTAMIVSTARIVSPIIIAALQGLAPPDCMAAAKAFGAQTVPNGLEV